MPGTTNIAEHAISGTSDAPVVCMPYPLPLTVKNKLKNIAELEKMNVIRRSDSEYASPIVVVEKNDSSDRVCADHRRLNKATLFDPEPMILADDLFQKLGTR